MDEGSGLVRQAEMTSANVHDSRFGEALIQGDEQGYFADKAYDSQALRETLERRGFVGGIAAWKVKHSRHPLETWQKLHNAWAASIRSGVERAFATMKRWYGIGRVRYLGLARNACTILQVHRHGDEHEAGARASAGCLTVTRSQERRVRERRKIRIASQNGHQNPRARPTKPVIANLTPHRPNNSLPLFCKALCWLL